MSSSQYEIQQQLQQQQQQQQLQQIQQQQALLLESKEREIAILQERCTTLSYQLQKALASSSSSSQQQWKNHPPQYHNNNNNNGNNTTTGTTTPNNNNNSNGKKLHHPLSPHVINVREVQQQQQYPQQQSSSSYHTTPNTNNNNNTTTTTTKMITTTQRERIGRNASIATRRVIDEIVKQQEQDNYYDGMSEYNNTDPNSNNNNQNSNPNNSKVLNKHQKKQQIMNDIIQRILYMFQNPTLSMDYLCHKQFAQDIFTLCKAICKTFEAEPKCIYISSPCYVFGDIHGNIEDLHFFSDNLWKLGMSLSAGNFLFLGDYVDRGLNCLETVAYLLAMKYTLPNKVFLLRGNHETRDVNGWEEHYHDRSFIYQCRYRFGNDIGYRIWEACNSVFDRLPLAAIIDQDIFCVHGGIPRPITQQHRRINGTTIPTTTSRIQDILSVPKVAGINPPYEHEDDIYQQVASDCIWSDPASEQQELHSVDPITGYGESLRGGGAICFGHTAVTNFLQEHNLSYIMRAHEAHADGVAISKGARVFTVFSTSQDHNQGCNAMAGCILVDNAKLQVINRSPAYKNQYVHRRDSISVASLSEQEIQRRMQFGLITPSLNNNNNHHHNSHAIQQQNATNSSDVEIQDWQDITDEEAATAGTATIQDTSIDDVENVVEGSNDNNEDDEEEYTDTEGSLDAIIDERYGNMNNGNTNPYLLDTKRRSSIELGHLSINLHDDNASIGSGSNSSIGIQQRTTTAGGGGKPTTSIIMNHVLMNDNSFSNKRLRYRQPSIASISEEEPSSLSNTNKTNTSITIHSQSNSMLDNDNDDDVEVATVDGNNDDEDTMEDI